MLKMFSHKQPASVRLIDRMVGHVVDRATQTAVYDVTVKGPMLIEGAPSDVLARLVANDAHMSHAFKPTYGGRIDDWNYIILVDAHKAV